MPNVWNNEGNFFCLLGKGMLVFVIIFCYTVCAIYHTAIYFVLLKIYKNTGAGYSNIVR